MLCAVCECSACIEYLNDLLHPFVLLYPTVQPLPKSIKLQVYFIKYTQVKFKYILSILYDDVYKYQCTISILVSALFQYSLGLDWPTF